MSSILSLPNEILQRVANYLNFSALLQLNLVNKRLSSICNDYLVVQHVAKYGFYNIPGAVSHTLQKYPNIKLHQLDWAYGEKFIDSMSFEQASHLACVIEKCTKLAMFNESQVVSGDKVKPDRSHISQWLSYLIVLKHPAALSLQPEVLFHTFYEAMEREVSFPRKNQPGRDATDVISISFALTLLTLQRLEITNDGEETAEPFREFHKLLGEDDREYISYFDSISAISECLFLLIPEAKGPGHIFTPLQASLAVLPSVIALSTPNSAYTEDLPKPSKMLFYNYMDVPNFYNADSAEKFPDCHLRTMTTPEFLAGQWMGFYSIFPNETGVFYCTMFYKMRVIEILAGPPSQHDVTAWSASAKIDRQSRGVDQDGEFSLEGRVCKDGQVSLVNRYLSGGSLRRWTGQVTPFGITGVWGGADDFGGYFWIWKTEWV